MVAISLVFAARIPAGITWMFAPIDVGSISAVSAMVDGFVEMASRPDIYWESEVLAGFSE